MNQPIGKPPFSGAFAVHFREVFSPLLAGGWLNFPQVTTFRTSGDQHVSLRRGARSHRGRWCPKTRFMTGVIKFGTHFWGRIKVDAYIYGKVLRDFPENNSAWCFGFLPSIWVKNIDSYDALEKNINRTKTKRNRGFFGLWRSIAIQD